MSIKLSAISKVFITLLVTFGLVFSVSLASIFADEAYAEVKNASVNTKPVNITKKGLKWNLKNGKSYKAKVMLTPDVGMKTYGTHGIYNLKKTKMKNGKTKITFTYKLNRKYKPTTKDVNKYLASIDKNWIRWTSNDSLDQNHLYWEHYFSVVDAKSGYSLERNSEKAKELGVKIKSKWTYKDYKRYYNSSKTRWLRLATTSLCKVTITMPSKYKDLCIGIGTTGKYFKTGYFSYTSPKGYYVSGAETTESFFSGLIPFTSTNLYKAKSNSHWMRIK